MTNRVAFNWFLTMLFFVVSISLYAQEPVAIKVEGKSIAQGQPEDCAAQTAGQVNFSNFTGQSNDIWGDPDVDTIFLCMDDRFDVNITGLDLTGDPDMSTGAGVGYAFYSGKPIQSGPNKAAVDLDPHYPPATPNWWIASGCNPSGQMVFKNTGILQGALAAGGPILVWFAPITYDKLDTINPGPSQSCTATYENGGPCVKVSVDEAFPVVYLNAVQATNKQHSVVGFGCKGRFIVKGGMPELDGSNYDIDISLASSPTTKAILTDDSYSHDEYVSFQVGEGGIYNITISDGKSCVFTDTILMPGCPTIAIDLPDTVGEQGSKLCIPITVQDFINISSLEFTINWDSTILAFDGVDSGNLEGLKTPLELSQSFNLLDSGKLVLLWTKLLEGQTLPDNDTIFMLCFNLIGPKGSVSPVWIGPNDNGIAIADPSGTQYGMKISSQEGSIKIQNPNALGIVLDSTDVVCLGGTSGAFGVTVTGGAYPITMTWDEQGGANSGTVTFNSSGQHEPVSGLVSGIYDLHFVDAVNGVQDTLVHIGKGRKLLALLQQPVPGPACNGDSIQLCVDVRLDDNPVTNFSGYSFNWGSGSTKECQKVVLDNFFAYTVTDPFGCVATASGGLGQPDAISINDTPTNPTCSGKANGVIDIQPTGGTSGDGNYTFIWAHRSDTTINASSTVIGLDTGYYYLTVTDDNNCIVSDVFHLGFDKVIDLSVISQDITCAGSDDGQITATATNMGGIEALPYTFNWAPNPANKTNPNANTEVATSLMAGSYLITVTDDDGCLDTITTVLTEPDSMMITLVSLRHESCNGMPIGGDGEISISVSGGGGGYSYAWNMVAGGGPDIKDLSAGSYTVEVTDVNNCVKAKTFIINPPNPPIISGFTKVDVNCPTDNNGSLKANVTPGNGTAISYSWSTGSVDSTITGLATGKYTVTVSDEYGCQAALTDSIISTQGYFIQDTTFNTPQCVGLSNGTITVIMSDMGATFNYFWDFDSSNTTNFLPNAPAGTYNVTITNNSSVCPPIEATLVLDDPHQILTDITLLQDASCFDGTANDGSATVRASYSDGEAGTFNFVWGPNSYLCNMVTECTSINLALGTNVVAVSDGSCIVYDTIQVSSPDSILVTTAIQDVSCFGYSDGSILAIASGGTPGTNPDYIYSWVPGGGGAQLSNAAAGNYVLSVTDDVGCSETFNLVIDEPQLLELQINDTKTVDVRCHGESTGIVFVQATGGNGDEVYQWSPNVSDTHVATLLPAGTYNVTVTDKKGCTQEISHTLLENDPITADLAPILEPECFGYQTVIAVDTAYGGSGAPYYFSVDFSPPQSIKLDYQVFADSHIVIIYDAFECKVEYKVHISEPDEIYVSLPANLEVELGDSLQLSPVVSSSLPIDSFFWTPIVYLNPDSVLMPQVVGLTQDQNYEITVVDVNGCTSTANVLVEVDRNRNVFIPNIFSPNGDGFNDFFFPKTGIGVRQVNYMNIYDRWGEIIYFAKDFLPGDNSTKYWDGSYKGKALSPGVFVYLIEVEFLDGIKLLYRGDITLLK